jgi:uncharacterized protein (TIRG00374 family)
VGRIQIASQTTNGRKDWGKIIPGVIVSVVALVIVLSLIDLDELNEALSNANYLLLILGGLLTIPWLLVRGVFWRTLLQYKAAYKDVFFTLNEGYLLNNVLPFRLGEIGRAFLLGKKASLDFWQVLSSILIERILDLAIAVGIFLCTLPFVIGVSWAVQAAVFVGVIVVVGLLCLYLVARYQTVILGWLERLSQRVSLLERFTGRHLAAFFDGLAVLTDKTLFLRAIGWLILNWSITILQYFVILRAFFPDADMLWAVFLMGAGALGVAAPSSPGNIGVFEAVLVGALAIFGVNPSAAAAFAFFIHFNSFMITGVIGGYALLRDGESLIHLYRELRQRQGEDESRAE